MPDPNPQQHTELASFGEELRREREIRGISLKEIADATKISRRFLEAIERNDHKTLPAPVFTRGFVREYARYLGLNSEEMVSRYNYGALGDDRIVGSDSNDFLSGGGGDDLLLAGAGGDVLRGGKGRDEGFGGSGADTYSVRSQFWGRALMLEPKEAH